MTEMIRIWLRRFPWLRVGCGVVRLFVPTCRFIILSIFRPRNFRYFPAWLISNIVPGRSAILDAVPWITFEARDWLNSHLAGDMSIFEYGSGGSTIYFSRSGGKVISVEHDPVWHDAVSATLRKLGIVNVDYRLEPPSPTRNSDGGDIGPGTFRSHVQKDMDFSSYVNSISSVPDGTLDVVFVDGRARNSCISLAKGKVKPGGVLVLDNSERREYDPGRAVMNDWEVLEFWGPGPYGHDFWGTTIWKRSLANVRSHRG